MARVEISAISCGVYQLYNLDGRSDQILKSLMSAYKGQAQREDRKHGFAQAILSDAYAPPLLPGLGLYRDWNSPKANWKTRNGHRFIDYLKKNFPKIEVVELKANESPSTGNDIATWIVNIPHTAFCKHKFYKKIKGISPRDLNNEEWN